MSGSRFVYCNGGLSEALGRIFRLILDFLKINGLKGGLPESRKKTSDKATLSLVCWSLSLSSHSGSVSGAAAASVG